MPASALITRSGPVATPLDYVVPNAAELIAWSVTATVDGTNAASAFAPELQIIAPNGAVVARCPAASSIPPGGAADVSWFPGMTTPAAITPNTGGNWQPYTPVWSTPSGTQPSIGNGSILGLYYQLGRYVTCRVVLTIGSTTTLGGSGILWHFSLPVLGTSLPSSANFGLSSVGAHSGSSVFFWGFQDGTTVMGTFATLGAASSPVQFVSNGFPAAWAAGDVIRSGCIYQAA